MKLNLLFIIICIFGMIAGCNQNPDKESMQIDHIILAINDLDSGINQFEKMTGIKAVDGGEHPNSFTQNAIVPLTNRMYVEILAPKNGLDSIPDFFKDINELRPIGFAIATNDIEILEKTIKDLQFETSGVEDWSRMQPNGEELKWKLLQINDPNLYINPFFIQWSSDTKHPSHHENIQSSLEELTLKTPYKSKISEILSKNNAEIHSMKMEDADTNGLILMLKTPKGIITLFG